MNHLSAFLDQIILLIGRPPMAIMFLVLLLACVSLSPFGLFIGSVVDEWRMRKKVAKYRKDNSVDAEKKLLVAGLEHFGTREPIIKIRK